MKKSNKKTKQSLYFKKLNCGIFPFKVLFTIGTTGEQVIKYLETTFGYELNEDEKSCFNFSSIGGKTIQLRNHHIIIWAKSDYIPVITHELSHVVEFVLLKHICPFNDDTSEVYAYLLEHLMRQVCENQNTHLFK